MGGRDDVTVFSIMFLFLLVMYCIAENSICFCGFGVGREVGCIRCGVGGILVMVFVWVFCCLVCWRLDLIVLCR